jgi:hypothetical protein
MVKKGDSQSGVFMLIFGMTQSMNTLLFSGNERRVTSPILRAPSLRRATGFQALRGWWSRLSDSPNTIPGESAD